MLADQSVVQGCILPCNKSTLWFAIFPVVCNTTLYYLCYNNNNTFAKRQQRNPTSKIWWIWRQKEYGGVGERVCGVCVCVWATSLHIAALVSLSLSGRFSSNSLRIATIRTTNNKPNITTTKLTMTNRKVMNTRMDLVFCAIFGDGKATVCRWRTSAD